MDIEQLMTVLEERAITGNDRKRVELLLAAINDWPTPVESLNDFLSKLKSSLNAEEITIEVVTDRVADMTPGFDAWKMESLSSLLELLNMSGIASLNQIIANYQSLQYGKGR
ncbi:hypothetical protein D0C36_06720 [Mucilaginibacter conchicola]|uniref:Uncharacterized protein n=1 Tax=Mucilaginibacter conchicola TaxID=2303333 RepID=A0A372NYN4_9SPHI|nr:hypothetical protein [Mucilaginibacter conchicola]RFZ95215.1 hypothetical protein D0C36_06720 [Mucilaginibacter conchicola]